MFLTSLVMAAIELSLFVDKPRARVFAVTVLAIGLILRALAREKSQRSSLAIIVAIIGVLFLDNIFVLHDYKTGFLAITVLAFAMVLRGLYSERAEKKLAAATSAGPILAGAAGVSGMSGALTAQTAALESPTLTTAGEVLAAPEERMPMPLPTSGLPMGEPLLCAVRGLGRTLDFAIEEARSSNRPLYLLFIREQFVLTSEDRKRKWQADPEAAMIFNAAIKKAKGHTVLPCYAVSDSPSDTIVDVAATVGASRLILGAPHRTGLVKLLRGNIIQKMRRSLSPENIHLLVYA